MRREYLGFNSIGWPSRCQHCGSSRIDGSPAVPPDCRSSVPRVFRSSATHRGTKPTPLSPKQEFGVSFTEMSLSRRCSFRAVQPHSRPR
jgi:hypothetical protein